jgi:hypothetical protein
MGRWYLLHTLVLPSSGEQVFVIHVHPVHTGAEGIDGEDVIA